MKMARDGNKIDARVAVEGAAKLENKQKLETNRKTK